MTYQTLQQAAETRRSIYALNKNLPVSNEEISEIVKHAVLHTPSSFNSQSTRVVVLFGEEHGKVWQFVEDALRAIVPAEQFEPTAQKLNLFKAGAATILFFEDQNVVKGLQEQFPFLRRQLPRLGGPCERDDAIRPLDNACRRRRGREPATLQPATRRRHRQRMEPARKLALARANGHRRHRSACR